MNAWDIIGLACFFAPGIVIELARLMRAHKEK